MALIANGARATKNLSIKVGANDYAHHVNDVKVTNDAKAVVWKGGTPTSIINDIGVTSYMLELSIVNDYTSLTSLFNTLITQAGQSVTFIFKPEETATFMVTVTAVVIPPQIGGAVDKFDGQTLKMPCSKPVIVQPA